MACTRNERERCSRASWPGDRYLALSLVRGQGTPRVVAKGEAVMIAELMDQGSRQRECRGRDVGGGGGMLSWNGNAMKFDLLVKRPLAKVWLANAARRVFNASLAVNIQELRQCVRDFDSPFKSIVSIHCVALFSSIHISSLPFISSSHCCVYQVHSSMPGLMSCVTFKRRSRTRWYHESFALLISAYLTRHSRIEK